VFTQILYNSDYIVFGLGLRQRIGPPATTLPGKEVGLIIRLYPPKKEMRYNICTNLTIWKLKLYIFWWYHGRDAESRYKAKITVIAAIGNSWFCIHPNYCA